MPRLFRRPRKHVELLAEKPGGPKNALAFDGKPNRSLLMTSKIRMRSPSLDFRLVLRN